MNELLERIAKNTGLSYQVTNRVLTLYLILK